MADKKASGKRACAAAPRRPTFAKWSKAFLAQLATSSNVTAAAEVAGITTGTAYDAKRAKPEFNRQWRQALCEGYEHLEMELLHRFRTGEGKADAGDEKPVRKFDNATAFRLLTAHREEAAQQRAVRDNDDAEAILASIDAKLDRMRQRALEGDEDAAASENDADDAL
ncbi:MAG: hypothetical protein ABIT04_05860 [Novosphingobium sp.]